MDLVRQGVTVRIRTTPADPGLLVQRGAVRRRQECDGGSGGTPRTFREDPSGASDDHARGERYALEMHGEGDSRSTRRVGIDGINRNDHWGTRKHTVIRCDHFDRNAFHDVPLECGLHGSSAIATVGSGQSVDAVDARSAPVRSDEAVHHQSHSALRKWLR
jgi:hypothetical protein